VEMKTWNPENIKLLLSVDIGGTNCRLALSNQMSPYKLLEIAKFQSSSTTHLIENFEALEKEIFDLIGVYPVSAAIDVAGPIAHDKKSVTVTNYPLDQPRVLKVSGLPKYLFPVNRTILVNDLAATCYGIEALSNMASLDKYFNVVLGSGKVTLDPTRHYVVAAVGTGLGTGLLVSVHGERFVLPCEYGHVKIPPLGSAQAGAVVERKLLEFIGNKLYKGEHSPEYEDIVSGRGLAMCYEFVSNGKTATPKEVAERAVNGDADCVQALKWHYEYLFRDCREIAIGTLAAGVFLCGDNQVHNIKFIEAHKDAWKKEFEETHKRDWLKDVIVYGQSELMNANLLGCAHVAAQAYLRWS